MRPAKIGHTIFWILAITDAALIFQNLEAFRVYTKPFLVPILLITILLSISRSQHKAFKVILSLAFVSAFLGDIFLLKALPASSNFTWGLACFLFTHIMLIVYFFKIQSLNLRESTGFLLTLLAMAGISIWLIGFLKPYLGNLLLPIAVYSFFLSLMMAATMNLTSSTAVKQTAIDTFIPGALLFVLSDSMLALNRFFFEEQVLDAAVMLTYCGAMFYLSKGFIKHLRKRRSRSRKVVLS